MSQQSRQDDSAKAATLHTSPQHSPQAVRNRKDRQYRARCRELGITPVPLPER